MSRTHRFNILVVVSVSAWLAACRGATPPEQEQGEASVAESRSALDACASPPVGSGSLCDLGGGSVEFLVTLPSNQAYVEVFSRQNGLQNVATNIAGSADVHDDGTTTYSLARGGYAEGDVIEYRFYSYLPASPGVFTPGPSEGTWLSYVVPRPSELDLQVVKDASLIATSYATGPAWNRNFGTASTVDVAYYHHDSLGLFGYSLAELEVSDVVTRAELVIPSLWEVGGGPGLVALYRVNDSTSWDELTVTRSTTPAATYFADFALSQSGESRLEVTPLVQAATARGDTEISFLLVSVRDNVFIDSKEKPGGHPTYLHVARAD